MALIFTHSFDTATSEQACGSLTLDGVPVNATVEGRFLCLASDLLVPSGGATVTRLAAECAQ